MKHLKLIQDFIEEIWNNRDIEKLDYYLHINYCDYSLPQGIEGNKDGTLKWIVNTGISFDHRTEIINIVEEDDLCIVRIKMHLKHIGQWRTHAATHMELSTNGFRQFQIKDNKIVAHWALIDAEAIENALRNNNRTCEIH